MIASSPPLATPRRTSPLPDIQFGRLSRDMGRNRATRFSLWTSSTSRKFCRPIFHDGENGRRVFQRKHTRPRGERVSSASLLSTFATNVSRVGYFGSGPIRVLKSRYRERRTRHVDTQSEYFFFFSSFSQCFFFFFFFFSFPFSPVACKERLLIVIEFFPTREGSERKLRSDEVSQKRPHAIDVPARHG